MPFYSAHHHHQHLSVQTISAKPAAHFAYASHVYVTAFTHVGMYYVVCSMLRWPALEPVVQSLQEQE